MDFKEREVREIVWGYKVKFKNETEDEHVLSKAPKYMPYIIIKSENDEYYAMLVTDKPTVGKKYFCLIKSKYPETKSNLYIKLDGIYKLKRTDIIKNFLAGFAENLKISERDYITLLDYIKSANALDIEDKLVFNNIYNEVSPLDVKDIICIKEDEEFKEYTIINQINENEFYGLKTNIPTRMSKRFMNMVFDYSDIRIFSKKDEVYKKYSSILSDEEIEKISKRVEFYRSDLFQNQYNERYEFGTIIDNNGSEYIVLSDEYDAIYLTKRSDFYQQLTISKLPKEKFESKKIGMLDIKTRIKLLKRLECDIKEIGTPKLQKEVVEKIKCYKKEEDIL